MYAKIVNGEITKTLKVLPNWYNTKGELLGIDWFMKNEGVFPVIDTYPTHDSFYQTVSLDNYSNWSINQGVDENGEPIILSVSNKYTVIDMTVEELSLIKKSMLVQVRNNYEQGGYGGVLSTGKSVRLHSDKQSQFNILGIMAMSTVGCSNFKSLDGYISLTQEELLEVASTLYNFVQNCYHREKEIIDLIDGCSTVEDIRSIMPEFETGWPEGSMYSFNF